jgi:nitroreductase
MTALAWEILDLARWAPSGDNSQPWRFEVRSDEHLVVHAFDTRRHCVYDLEGRASQLSVGAMLETLRIAASLHGRAARVTRRTDAPEAFPVFDVHLVPAQAAPDPLHASIRARSVQRKPLDTRRLDAAAKADLAKAVGRDYTIAWFEGWRERSRLAWLAVRSAKIRLTIPEAYAVHRDIIAWDAEFSEDRVPDRALGASTPSIRSMRWAMASWERVRFMNRYAGGTWAPRLELDWLPGMRCAAHFAIVAARPPAGVDDYVAAGAAVQRFWLTATSLGLQLQPQYTPLVFAGYARTGATFTDDPAARRRAVEVKHRLEGLLGAPAAEAAVFLGRVGYGPAARSRSLRLPLASLTWTDRDEPR